MTERPSDPLEKLVAEHLDRDAAKVDVPCLWAAMQRKLAEPEAEIAPAQAAAAPTAAAPSRRGLPHPARWALALAASLMLVLLGAVMWTGSVQAETLVREVEAKQQLDVDRHYEIRSELLGDFRQRYPLLAQSGVEQVHVRGDRFWVEAHKGDGKLPLERHGLKWGRDEDGRVWLALTQRLGLRFEKDEAPEPLRLFLAVRGAQVDSILKALLADFDVKFDLTAPRPGFAKIKASLKPGHRHDTLAAAELTIHEADRELEELVLHRELQGRKLAKVHLTRQADQPQPAEAYRLERHLLSPSMILDKAQAKGRSEALRKLFGEPSPKN